MAGQWLGQVKLHCSVPIIKVIQRGEGEKGAEGKEEKRKRNKERIKPLISADFQNSS